MAESKIKYAAPVAISHTPAGVASGVYDGSALVSNSIDLFEDVIVGGFVTTGTTPTVNKRIIIYAYASWDAGTTFTAGVSGTDGGTPNVGEENSLAYLTTIKIDATSDHRYEFGPFSIAAAFGGIMPEKWGIVIYHDTGVVLNATAANHEIKYTGVTRTSA